MRGNIHLTVAAAAILMASALAFIVVQALNGALVASNFVLLGVAMLVALAIVVGTARFNGKPMRRRGYLVVAILLLAAVDGAMWLTMLNGGKSSFLGVAPYLVVIVVAIATLAWSRRKSGGDEA